MKKVITLVLTLALLATSVSAFAAATPGINAFPTLTTVGVSKIPGIDVQYYKVILSGPVERFYVLWNENKDGGAQELAVYENAAGQLEADAMAATKKWMPGVKDNKGAFRAQVKDDPKPAEVIDVYNLPGMVWVSDPNAPAGVVAGHYVDTKNQQVKGKDVQAALEKQVKLYEDAHYSDLHTKKGITDFSIATLPTIGDDGTVVFDTTMAGTNITVQIVHREKLAADAKKSSNKALPSDAAYAAVVIVDEAEFVAFYNRAGLLVGIEENEGRY